MKKNCWEIKKCGRQSGGNRVDELGVCPASTESKAHGINRGKNGGRACWVIKDTLCDDKVQGSFSKKIVTCFACDFYNTVRNEEGLQFVVSKDILENLHNKSHVVEKSG